MTVSAFSLAHLSDHDLLAAVKNSAQHEREATIHLIASLTELDARRLYVREGCSSLFAYCTQVLHLSDDVELNIIGLMLRAPLCEAGGRLRLSKPHDRAPAPHKDLG